jgi:hypothetical protein
VSTVPAFDEPFEDQDPHARDGHDGRVPGIGPRPGYPPELAVVGLPRILLDARVVLNQPTGLGRYTAGLARGIIEARLPLDVTLLVHTDLATDHPLYRLPDAAEPPTRVRIVPVPVPGVHPSQHFRLLGHFGNIKHDLYHYPHYDLPLTARKPSIVTIHDLKFLRFPELLPNRLRAGYVRGAMRLATRRARHIVAVSSSTRDDLEELLGVSPTRVTVIPEAAANAGGCSNPVAFSGVREGDVHNCLPAGERLGLLPWTSII